MLCSTGILLIRAQGYMLAEVNVVVATQMPQQTLKRAAWMPRLVLFGPT